MWHIYSKHIFFTIMLVNDISERVVIRNGHQSEGSSGEGMWVSGGFGAEGILGDLLEKGWE